jgi:hypothetical protein
MKLFKNFDIILFLLNLGIAIVAIGGVAIIVLGSMQAISNIQTF